MRIFRFRLYRLDLHPNRALLPCQASAWLELVLLGEGKSERLAIRNEMPRLVRGFSLAVNVRYWPLADPQKSDFGHFDRPLYTRKRPLS